MLRGDFRGDPWRPVRAGDPWRPDFGTLKIACPDRTPRLLAACSCSGHPVRSFGGDAF